MAVTFQSATTYPPATTTAATTSAVWAYPSGIVAGDALVLAAVNNDPGGGTATTFTTPTGWTLKQNSNAINTDTTVAFYLKIAAGTESGTNLTLGMSASSLCTAAILRYTGNKNTAVTGWTSSLAISSSAGTTSPAHTALSPVPGASDMVVRMYGWAQNNSGTGSALPNPTGGWTSRANLFTNVSGAFQCAIVVAELLAGTSDSNITAASGGWGVIDAALPVGTTGSPSHNYQLNQAVVRAAFR